MLVRKKDRRIRVIRHLLHVTQEDMMSAVLRSVPANSFEVGGRLAADKEKRIDTAKAMVQPSQPKPEQELLSRLLLPHLVQHICRRMVSPHSRLSPH